MNQVELATDLKHIVNWKGLFTLINDLGNQLNDRQLRFMKARLIESSISRMSQNQIVEWVDNIGQDHQYKDIRIETKYCTNALTTGTGAPKRSERTSEIKLTNTLGSSDGRDLPDTFDYLMIVDNDASAIISRDKLLPYVVSAGDGLKAKVPFAELTFITHIDKNALTLGKKVDIMNKLDSLLFSLADSYNL